MKKWKKRNSNEKRLGGFSKIFKPNSDTTWVCSNAGNLIGVADLFTNDLNLLNPSAKEFYLRPIVSRYRLTNKTSQVARTAKTTLSIYPAIYPVIFPLEFMVNVELLLACLAVADQPVSLPLELAVTLGEAAKP